jgi:hypothetical protein
MTLQASKLFSSAAVDSPIRICNYQYSPIAIHAVLDGDDCEAVEIYTNSGEHSESLVSGMKVIF